MTISFSSSGSLNKTEAWMKKMSKMELARKLDAYGKKGVDALSSATPVDSGETARSWGYKIVKSRTGFSIIWTNSHVVNGAKIAILIQYGHGTGTGGYVQGRDYINPAIRPIFDQITSDILKEVSVNA